MPKCDLCGRDRPQEVCHDLELTGVEKTYLRASGVERDHLTYCKSCWRALSDDRQQGARIVQGLFQSWLKQRGSGLSEQKAAELFKLLVGKNAV